MSWRRDAPLLQLLLLPPPLSLNITATQNCCWPACATPPLPSVRVLLLCCLPGTPFLLSSSHSSLISSVWVPSFHFNPVAPGTAWLMLSCECLPAHLPLHTVTSSGEGTVCVSSWHKVGYRGGVISGPTEPKGPQPFPGRPAKQEKGSSALSVSHQTLFGRPVVHPPLALPSSRPVALPQENKHRYSLISGRPVLAARLAFESFPCINFRRNINMVLGCLFQEEKTGNPAYSLERKHVCWPGGARATLEPLWEHLVLPSSLCPAPQHGPETALLIACCSC